MTEEIHLPEQIIKQLIIYWEQDNNIIPSQMGIQRQETGQETDEPLRMDQKKWTDDRGPAALSLVLSVVWESLTSWLLLRLRLTWHCEVHEESLP